MRKKVELLRLLSSGLSERQVARSCGISRSTVAVYRLRLKEAGVTWPLPEGVDEDALEQKLFPGSAVRTRDEARPLPDWKQIHHELTTRKAVTLRLLWKEYREGQPAG